MTTCLVQPLVYYSRLFITAPVYYEHPFTLYCVCIVDVARVRDQRVSVSRLQQIRQHSKQGA